MSSTANLFAYGVQTFFKHGMISLELCTSVPSETPFHRTWCTGLYRGSLKCWDQKTMSFHCYLNRDHSFHAKSVFMRMVCNFRRVTGNKIKVWRWATLPITLSTLCLVCLPPSSCIPYLLPIWKSCKRWRLLKSEPIVFHVCSAQYVMKRFLIWDRKNFTARTWGSNGCRWHGIRWNLVRDRPAGSICVISQR